jgi:hypothetical protein
VRVAVTAPTAIPSNRIAAACSVEPVVMTSSTRIIGTVAGLLKKIGALLPAEFLPV